jgi:carbamoyltransferase
MRQMTLGLNFFGGHDTSIFAIFDNECYGLSQERVTRIKHDAIFPIDAIKELIRYKEIDPHAIESLRVGVATLAFQKRLFNEYSYEMTTALRNMLRDDQKALYIKEFVAKKEELMKSSLPGKLRRFLFNEYGRTYLKNQIFGKKRPLDAIIRKHLTNLFPNASLDITFYEHHLTHAYSAYYASPFESALVFTFDGEGDGCFSKIYSVDKGTFKQLGESKNRFVKNMERYDFADSGYSSVGNIYSIFTHLLGYTPNADEGKVEALAAYGNYDNQLYTQLIQAHTVDPKRVSIEIDTEALDHLFDSQNLKHIFDTLSKEDISAAVQRFTEEIICDYLHTVQSKHPHQNLILAGGVTANVIANLRIFEECFENLFIVPAMGDDGISQGAAVMKYLELHPEKKADYRFPQMPYYGSSYTETEIESALKESGLTYTYMGEDAYTKAAEAIVNGKVGALFHGRCEFGPRALGNRSIIADVRNKEIQKHINQNIKKRPLFQPFCPSILAQERERLFEKSYNNKHMTIAFKLKPEYKEEIPGAVHVDLTARVQFVSPKDNPNYHRLIEEVRAQTGYGVIINTSFNKHGRTMVLTPQDAIVDFRDTNLDFMVMEGFWVTKEQ